MQIREVNAKGWLHLGVWRQQVAPCRHHCSVMALACVWMVACDGCAGPVVLAVPWAASCAALARSRHWLVAQDSGAAGQPLRDGLVHCGQLPLLALCHRANLRAMPLRQRTYLVPGTRPCTADNPPDSQGLVLHAGLVDRLARAAA